MARIVSIIALIAMLMVPSGNAFAQEASATTNVISFGENFEGMLIQLQPGQRIHVFQANGLETMFEGDIVAIMVPGDIANLVMENTLEPVVGMLPEGKALMIFEPDGAKSIYWGFPEMFTFSIEMGI